MDINFIQEIFEQLTEDLRSSLPKEEEIIDFLIDRLEIYKKKFKNELAEFFRENRCNRYNNRKFKNTVCNQKCEFFHMSRREICFCNKLSNRKCKMFHPLSYEDLDQYHESVVRYDLNNQKLHQLGYIKMNSWNKVEKMRTVKASGIIPYKIVNNEIFLLMGYEKKKSNSFRFFGGKRDVFLDENCFDTAIREFCEEIYGSFDEETFSIEKSISKLKGRLEDVPINKYEFSGQHQIFLLPILENELNLDVLEKGRLFYEKNNKYQEKLDFVWIKFNDLLEIYEKNMNVVSKKYKGPIKKYDYSFVKIMKYEISRIFTGFENYLLRIKKEQEEKRKQIILRNEKYMKELRQETKRILSEWVNLK